MNRSLRNAVLVALAQTALLVAGILGVAASNRLAREFGHPDLRDFLFFLNHGWLLLPLPVLWITVAGWWLLRRPVRPAHEGAVVLSGIALATLFAGALTWETAEPWRSGKPARPAWPDSEHPSLTHVEPAR
jgi:hypothetical protein